MVKAWLKLWRNTFNYTGTATCREYWLGLIMNVIAMYVGVLPCALLIKLVGNIDVLIIAYIVFMQLPAFSIYFRRARGAGWKMGTAVYLAIVTPGISGLIVGMITQPVVVSKGQSLMLKLCALGFGLFFYGGVLGGILYGDPTAIPALPSAGIALIGIILIWNWVMQKILKRKARSGANKV